MPSSGRIGWTDGKSRVPQALSRRNSLTTLVYLSFYNAPPYKAFHPWDVAGPRPCRHDASCARRGGQLLGTTSVATDPVPSAGWVSVRVTVTRSTADVPGQLESAAALIVRSVGPKDRYRQCIDGRQRMIEPRRAAEALGCLPPAGARIRTMTSCTRGFTPGKAVKPNA